MRRAMTEEELAEFLRAKDARANNPKPGSMLTTITVKK